MHVGRNKVREMLHSADGPALINNNNGSVCFFYNGQLINMKTWQRYANPSDETQVYITLKYADSLNEISWETMRPLARSPDSVISKFSARSLEYTDDEYFLIGGGYYVVPSHLLV